MEEGIPDGVILICLNVPHSNHKQYRSIQSKAQKSLIIEFCCIFFKENFNVLISGNFLLGNLLKM